MKHEDIDHSGVIGYGYAVRALPINWVATAAVTTVETLAANGGSVAIPVFIPDKMRLQDCAVRNTDTGTERTWGWDLYRDDNASNSATRVASSTANETFTPAGAASNRVIIATSAPVELPPGHYWLVVQNRHATNTFGLGYDAAGIFGPTVCQTKTTTNPNGATLDFVAATWTKNSRIYGASLRGRAFAQTSAF